MIYSLFPITGQAFEDAAVLTSLLEKQKGKASIAKTLETFETQRLPRVKRIHENQTTRFANTMKGKTEMWSEDFMAWVFDGPFATSTD